MRADSGFYTHRSPPAAEMDERFSPMTVRQHAAWSSMTPISLLDGGAADVGRNGYCPW